MKSETPLLILTALTVAAVSGFAAETYYVRTDGDNANDGKSWEAAFATVQHAVAQTAGGDSVLVSNGVYFVEVGTKVVITNGITLKSVNGAAVTSIRVADGPFPWQPLRTQVMHINHADAVVDGFTISKGWTPSGDYGGGVYVQNGNLLNCIVTDNRHQDGGAASGGGGVFLAAGVVSNCVISDNWSWHSGGGIKVSGGLVTHCVIRDNSIRHATQASGAAMNGGTLRNSLIVGNWGTSYGAVHLAAAAVMENCTVVENISANQPAVQVANNATIRNSIIRDNIYEVSDPRNFGLTPNVSYSNLEFPFSGDGNIAVDPLFFNRAAGDYRLSPDSPCIDQGDEQAWMTAGTDLAGKPRIHDAIPDMGAYEFTPGALECSIRPAYGYGLSPLENTLMAIVAGTNTASLYYRWSLTNSAVVDVQGNDLDEIVFSYAPGMHTIGLSVSNQVGETALSEYLLQVSSPTVFVARTGFNSSTYPYTDWATAASNVQDAVDAAVPGAVVLLTNGIHPTGNQTITLSKGIIVSSIGGRDFTEVNGGNQRCFYLESGNARVERLTLRRSSGEEAQGGVVYIRYGTVHDCLITGGSSNTGGSEGGGAGAYLLFGNLTHSTVAGNRTHGGGPPGAGIRVRDNGFVSHCVITNNKAEYTGTAQAYGTGGGVLLDAGTLRNSLIAFNEATQGGAGVRMGAVATMENCTLVGNIQPGYFAEQPNHPAALSVVNGATVYNTIVRDNIHTVTTPTNFGPAITTPNVTYSNLEFDWAGDGNLKVDAGFVNASGGDYRLAPGSDCIHTGTHRPWMTPDALDLDGYPRVAGPRPDMGAYEWQPPVAGTLFLVR